MPAPLNGIRGLGRVGMLAAVAIAVPLPALVGGSAHAAEGGETAVISPLLDFFDFSAVVGAPVFCGTTSAAAGSAFQEVGAAEQGDLLVDGINTNCDAFSTQSSEWVTQGRTAQAPLAGPVNPVLNPVIQQTADGVTKFGQDYGPALGPFGPTIAGSGSTIGFFAGSGPADGS